MTDRKITGFVCEYSVGNVYEVADKADIALVASGSATLQVAAAGCPMVVMYQSSRLMWHLVGRWLIRTRFLSLVNILAGRELVTEFMPYFSSIRPIVDRCSAIIGNKTLLVKTSMELENLIAPLTRGYASEEVLQMALSLLPDSTRFEKDMTLESHLSPSPSRPRQLNTR
jgi:lipid-A-disaccharide synthase